MEFFYEDKDGVKQGPFSELEMATWFREYYFYEDIKISFVYEKKTVHTTLKRMREKNGPSTPFIFAKCQRVEKEKQLIKTIEESARATAEIDKDIAAMKKSLEASALQSSQLMERMLRQVEAARAAAERNRAEREKEKEAPAPPPPQPARKTSTSKTAAASSAATGGAASKAKLPMLDVYPHAPGDPPPEIEDSQPIKAFRAALDEYDLETAQKALKFPISEKCRGCGGLPGADSLRAWLCHITSKNHMEKYRLKGGRITQACLDSYTKQLERFPKRVKKEKMVPQREEEPIDEGTVDLEKKRLECYGGVIMLPVYVPLLHVDPADTTRLPPARGKQELAKLRALLFDGHTDKYGAAKSIMLPSTRCDVCDERFDYAPRLVPHLLTNTHIEKYLAARGGGFSKHDFDFWTAICKLFPEADKDTRDVKAVRAQLRELGRTLDISKCPESLHYTIYGGEERWRHLVDFIKKQLLQHNRPVVVYVATEAAAASLLEQLRGQLPDTRLGLARNAADAEQLEVMIAEATLRLRRPHAIAFPAPPLEPRHKAEYAQRMCAEHVEANFIVAGGAEESAELRKFSRIVSYAPIAAPHSTTVTRPSPPPTIAPRPAPPVAAVQPFHAAAAATTPLTPPPLQPPPPLPRPTSKPASSRAPATPEKSKCAVM